MPSQLPPPVTSGASMLSPPQLSDDLAAVLSIEDEFNRVQELLKLAPRLPEELFYKVLDSVNLIGDQSLRATALVELAPYLNEAQVFRAFELISSLGLGDARLEGFGRIYSYVNPDTQSEIISKITNYSSNPEIRLKAWKGMAAFLSPERKEEAITAALSLTNEVERADALIALAPHLPDVWKIKALDAARRISDPLTRVDALSGLLPALPKKQRAEALDEALSLARDLPSPASQATALLNLQPQIPEELQSDLFQETYHAAQGIQDLQHQVEMFARLAETLPVRSRFTFLKGPVLQRLLEVQDEKARGDGLVLLARLSSGVLHTEILEAAKAIKDPRIKSSVVIQLQGIIEYQSSLPPPPGSGALPPGSGAANPYASAQVSSEVIQDFPASTEEQELQEPRSEIPNIEPTFKNVEASQTPPKPSPIETPPAKSKAPKSRVLRTKSPKVEVPVIDGTPEPPSPDESVGVKAYLHSDRWTLDDQLNYSLYADAIAEFILHTDTKPPLAIGVLAPWGQGKTTLMKLIQNQLQLKAKGPETPNPTGVVAPPITPSVNFEYLRKWLLDPTNYKLEVEKLNYPTVWFNAWKYQNSEQLWAGMAYSILSQMVGQISSQFEREKFWLALQAERVDFNAIRRDIHRMVFERIAPWILICFVIGVVSLVVFLFGVVAGNIILSGGGAAALVLSAVLSGVQWLLARAKVDSKPLEGKFAQYVRQPTYEGKLGFFHEIETDVQRVFRLLVAEGKPVVVFIDDLDRCSPGTVAQVIEAMNLFLSADFPDCYFVVGMDAQVVAASMEVAYENLDKKLKSVTRSYGSLGWYFMDKFIQLQFNIPNMTPDQRGTYLTRLFGQEVEKKEIIPAAELDIVEKKLEENLSSAALKAEQLPQQAAELSKLRLQRPQAWQRLSHTLIKTSAQQLSDNSPALQKYLKRYEPFLGVSPRGIKRFANLYRFYSLSQLSRQSQGLPASSPSALARWLVIMLRWPQVVRWIQWEGEAKLSVGTSAFSKAEALEDQLLKTTTHQAWIKYLEKLDPNHADWMSDKQLYDFLKTPARDDEKLSSAVQTGVW